MSATPTTQQTIAGGSNSEIGRKQPTSEDKVTKVVRWTFPTRLTPSKVTKHPPGGMPSDYKRDIWVGIAKEVPALAN
ncbi:hypothetical protein BLNAU_17072 [Blattamonas nauphoetae]|uniref:Uncharacterized protein n=1 Tax=Blattamonas nauphoetae TaxID=2049346 RepID=A0ABQ9X7T2_9EUKA|nr:hypothetical protein BLNAU_17072 [Blattamonas nauphoetae]